MRGTKLASGDFAHVADRDQIALAEHSQYSERSPTMFAVTLASLAFSPLARHAAVAPHGARAASPAMDLTVGVLAIQVQNKTPGESAADTTSHPHAPRAPLTRLRTSQPPHRAASPSTSPRWSASRA